MAIRKLFSSILSLLRRIAFVRLDVFCIVTPILLLSVLSNAEDSKWNLHNLNGIQSFHDGSNCLNAVLVAKGIVSKLVYIDSVEMRFFLENYCSSKSSPLISGDILAVIRENTIEHGALFLDAETIFEKHSTSGFYGQYGNSESNFYKITPKNKSEYFVDDQDVRKIENYSCLSAPKIHNNLKKSCPNQEIHTLVEKIRTQLQKITLTDNPVIPATDIPLAQIKDFGKMISGLSFTDSCAIYSFAVGASTFGSLYHLSNERPNNLDVKETARSLFNELINLKSRIEKNNPNITDQKIMSEFTWVGRP